MKRKMLISIALVVIMLLNCMLPLFVVTAAEGEGIQLNSKLYSAVKEQLLDQKIPFTCDDITHTLTLTEENKSKVSQLCLNENAIADLTGLEYFTSLEKLELSGNNITKDSNLGVLNSLPLLSYLDLSTNQLEDVSEIDELIKSIQDKKGTVLLSGQTVTIVHEAIIDEDEGSNNQSIVSYELPLILEKAGFVKSAWIKQSGIPEDGYSSLTPSLYSITNPINKENNEIQIRIASDNGVAYKGLYKLEIYIYDDPTEAASAANLNPAAKNILNGSRFYVYVVVHGSEDTAVFTPDTNLYKAVKKQLTAGQTENAELDSYAYALDNEGNLAFHTCFMLRQNDFMAYLYLQERFNNGTMPGNAATGGMPAPDFVLISLDGFKTGMIFDAETFMQNVSVDDICADMMDELAKYAYTTEYEVVDLRHIGMEGEVFLREGIKFQAKRNPETLYVKAYDDAKVFVIENEVLVNKISSLILNNKEIRDLSGLEKFVGLESYLNVSHNYLSDIDPIYELEKEKDAFEAKVQAKFRYWLSERNVGDTGNLTKSLSIIKSKESNMKAQMKLINKAVEDIAKIIKDASEIKKVNIKEEVVEKNVEGNAKVNVLPATDATAVADSVTIAPSKNIKLRVGATQQFVAAVLGDNLTNKTVTWSITGANSTTTTISADGLLTVGADETAANFTVVATSTDNTAITDDVVVNIVTELSEDTVLEVLPVVSGVKAGSTQQFVAGLTGSTQSASDIEWSVVGNNSTNTTVSAAGLLTVAADETATEIVVKATLKGGTEVKITTETNENYENDLKGKIESINKILDNIYGYTELDDEGNIVEHEGYLDFLRKDIKEINLNITNYEGLYRYLTELYSVYNDNYKLTSLLTPDVNYQTLEEAIAYKNLLSGTTDSVKGIYQNLINRLAELYSNDALSPFEMEITGAILGIDYYGYKEGENPVTKTFEKFFDNDAADRLYWANLVEEYRIMAMFTEMYNYCLIQRMENDNTIDYQCYAEEYLAKRIKKFELEGIDVSVEKEILEYFELMNTFSGRDADSNLQYLLLNLISIFKDFQEDYIDFENETDYWSVDLCRGPYTYLDGLKEDISYYESLEEVAALADVDPTDEEVRYVFQRMQGRLISSIDLYESVDLYNEYLSEPNYLYLYEELKALASKFVYNAGEVSRYVVLPDLRSLDISYNAELTGFERISELTGLRELFANANYITDLTEVNWEAMKYLRKLGLAYNYITNITPLEKLANIQELDVSHNLLSGKLEFNLTNLQRTLKELDLSYNQIDDIEAIMRFLDMWSNGNDGNYIAREDTININLNNQNLEINVVDPIYLDEYPQTVNIDLPKIFTQLLAIDVERTAFGETSQSGRVESEGKYVTLNTRTAGDKKGVVEVIAMSGNGTPVETCVGEGTKATINYKVVARSVSFVRVEPHEIEMKLGATEQFTAHVEGENLNDTSVVWTISGQTSAETVIAEDGKLTIGADETAETISVTATSAFDTTKSDTATVTVFENKPVVVVMELTPATAVVKTGATQAFTATVTGPEGTDTAVVWSVEGNASENTKVSENGVLTVAADETAETLTVKAVAKADTRIEKTATVTVEKVVTKVDKVNVTPSANVKVKAGATQKFVATVEGSNVADTTVTWSVEGNSSANTKVAADGTLTVGADETAKSFKVIATANADKTVKAEVVVTLDTAVVVDGVELGYKVEDEYLTTVNPKTPVSAFKTELLDNDDYKVIVKDEDGKVITSGHIATGMFVEVQDKDGNTVDGGNGLLVFEIIVMGDVNGDGVANSLDSIAIKAHRNEVKGQELVGSDLEAADINGDGKVNVTDTKLLLYHRAEVKGYNLNYAK